MKSTDKRYIIGKKFGLLTVKDFTNEKLSTRAIVYECICDCGNTRNVDSSSLRKGHVTRCKKCADKLRASIGKEYGMNAIGAALTVEGTNLAVISKQRQNSNNTSGFKGVIWDKSYNKWRAQITFKGKCYNLGRYIDIEDAIDARINAETRLFDPILEKYKEKGIIINGKDYSKYIK